MKTVKNLFLVDDDQLFTFLISKNIEDTELVEKITVFENGLEILNFLKQKKDTPNELPDIIFLDINMPIMDGWQFIENYEKFAHGVNKNITIYILSSSIFPRDIEKANKNSLIADYIVKPIPDDKLIALLKNHKKSA
ncbi:MAG: response regulator [Jejuia sp.]